jgi:hypothetical protein
MALIDTPLLNDLEISFFHQLIFDTPQLTQFIGRTSRFNAYDGARVTFFLNWKFRSYFHKHLTKRSSWEACVTSHGGSFYPWHRSAPRSSLKISFIWWSTFTSSRMNIGYRTGKRISRVINGWNFYIHL